jgi:two-component system, NarL family, invasion response regulator UvrY
MKPGELRILIADDHCLFRKGIILALSASLPEAKFGEAGDGAEALNAVRHGKWDLAILDISMPGHDGLFVLKEIKEKNPEIPVIMFSMYSEDQFALRAIKSGASAYLRKDVPETEFVKAIRKALNGERYFTPAIIDLMTKEIKDDHPATLHETLSDREYEVFLLIAAGMNGTQAAQKLGLSVKTISVHRSNILNKMSLKNNSEITYYAFKHKLID